MNDGHATLMQGRNLKRMERLCCPAEIERLSEIKKKKDTGGGCSVCGSNPAVNIKGTYWLCGPCVNEYYKPKKEK